MAPKDKDVTPTPTLAVHDADANRSSVAEEEAHGDVEEDLEVEAEAVAVPDTGDAGEGGKLKMIVQLLKRCLGVKDLAAMRLSLPASLLEPIPNLEYWHYLDRPDLFVSINDSEDPFERMLAVIRFTFTKDLKFIRGKVVKPYNSVLGEHFRAHWDVLPVEYSADPLQAPIHRQHITSPPPSILGKTSKGESVLSFRSGTSAKRASSIFDFAAARVTPLPKSAGPASPEQTPTNGAADAVESNLAAQVSSLSLGAASGSFESGGAVSGPEDAAEECVRVAFLTEQVSHHPPVSAYHAACPARGVALTGVDQISARVSGTSVRVSPGSQNRGIFVQLTAGPGEGEKYQITHPIAMVNGMLRGSFYVTVGESTIITCSGLRTGEAGGEGSERLRAIIEYKEEPWIGGPRFAVEGVVHTYREGEHTHEEWTKVKHVPRSAAVAFFDGSWRGRVRWRRADAPPAPAEEQALLLDLTPLQIVPKRVRPLARQHAYESRRLWESVTSNLLTKEYGEATRNKQAIEQCQRDKAAERKRKGEEFIPVFFERDIESGMPKLTPEGVKALEEELKTTDGES
ncbi:hypothetical protein DFH11DRAFT_1506631 [Phellopilus nigrolimitatus]|nr:hypothetical protein DFH11DRAFT_1506631 [Phellopilus nigrolimitatus]